MKEGKKLNQEQLEQVTGGTSDDPEHREYICPFCGKQMVFLNYQRNNTQVVYECPRCRDVEVYSC